VALTKPKKESAKTPSQSAPNPDDDLTAPQKLARQLFNAKVAPDTGDGSGPSVVQDVVPWQGKITLTSSTPVTGAKLVVVSADFAGDAFEFSITGGNLRKRKDDDIRIDEQFDQTFSVHVEPEHADFIRSLLSNRYGMLRRCMLEWLKDVDLTMQKNENSYTLKFFDPNQEVQDDTLSRYYYVFTALRLFLDNLTALSKDKQ